MISNNEYLWAYKNQNENFTKNGGFRLVEGDVVEVELDMKRKTITFHNERLRHRKAIKITYEPEISDDEYHIAVGLYRPGD